MLTKLLLTFFVGLLLDPVHGWAPAPTPAPSKLPKAVDVVKKPWRFPVKDHQDKTPVEDDHFFDGHGSPSMRWNDPPAFVPQPVKPTAFVADQRADQDCEHHFFDGMGDPLCWVSSSTTSETLVEPDDHYFDGHGTASIRWNAPLAHPTFVKPKTAHVPPSVLESKKLDADRFYFDGFGPVAHWPTNKVETKDREYFDGFSTGMKWNDHRLYADLVKVKPPMLTDPEDEECAEFFYEATGDVLCWVSSVAEAPFKGELEDFDFYDGLGESVQWWNIIHSMPPLEKKVKVLASKQVKDCAVTYFDGFDEVCWGP